MGLSAVRRPASSLALRIYIFGLVQFAILALGMFAVLTRSQRAPLSFVDTLSFMVSAVADTGGDRDAVVRVVSNIRSSLNCIVAVYDDRGNLVAGDKELTAPAALSQLVPLAPDLVAPVPMGRGSHWHLAFLVQPPIRLPPVLWAWITLVVGGVGIFSLLIARSLARPLARLTRAAQEFGSGKLDARVHMKRSDELGQVADAFDQMADRVTRALRVEKELLANVSHELRTPLQRIHIAVDLAAEGNAGTARESLGEIAEDLSELERIVEDVLTATRLSLSDGVVGTSGSPPIRPESVDVRMLLEKSTTRFRNAHPQRPLKVTVAADLPTLTADTVLLRRVVDNLLDNAHKYTENPDAEISLVAISHSGRLAIEVNDRGVGISPEDLKLVFEPFFRTDRSRARMTGGLGLGLALGRRIVEAHGGKLSIESVIGAGTSARIELPIQQT